MTLKSLVPWILPSLAITLFLPEAHGRVTNRNANPGSATSQVPRSPATHSPISRPQQRPSVPATRPSAPTTRPSVPATRPSVPATRPSVPATRPSVPATRPSVPSTRPSLLVGRPSLPVERPGNRPSTRPSTGAGKLPGLRPTERPNTLPGTVTFPRPGRPGGGSVSRPDLGLPGNVTRPNLSRPGDLSRPAIGRPGTIARPDYTLPSISNRPNFGISNRPETRPNRPGWGNEWGNWGDWNRPGTRPILGNHNTIHHITINNSWNWSYRPNYWGSRPWWITHHHHHWHHGCWNYGWSSSYRQHSFASGFFWGLATWTLGNLVFNSGYQTYLNPFPAPPIISQGGTTIINYSQPITVAAAGLPPGDAAAQAAADETANAAMDESRAALRKGNYTAALAAVDRAIAAVPGDPAMHEFRALVFFAMGRFNEASGVLNPVLASGPGWDWTTMTGLFDSQETYAAHLRKLEEHHDANPDSAAANFLLGYHYLVLGHLEESHKLFSRAAELEPTDAVSASLRDLLRDSIESDGNPQNNTAPPVPVPAEKLVGTWVSAREDGGRITLVLRENGEFTWTFDKTGDAGKLAGAFAIENDNRLVLSSPDSQMVGMVAMLDDSKLSFVLAGGPRGDLGLTFDRQL